MDKLAEEGRIALCNQAFSVLEPGSARSHGEVDDCGFRAQTCWLKGKIASLYGPSSLG